MRGHGEHTVEGRKKAIEAARKERDTQVPGYCFGFSESLRFDEKLPTDASLASLLRRAINRDASYSTANSLFLRKAAFNSGIKSVFSGGRTIIQQQDE